MLDMRDIGVELAMLLDKKDPMPACSKSSI
jgi:hypothetical protein